MPDKRKFLLVDENPDTRALLTRSLLRKFPAAEMLEADNLATAINHAATQRLAAIVVHRTVEARGAELVQLLRRISPDVPLVAMSGADKGRETLAAGANVFLLAEEWLRVASIVAGLLAENEPEPEMPSEKDRT